MRPILFTIPALPASLLPFIWAIVAGGALLWAFKSPRTERLFPLLLAGGLGFAAWFWTRGAIPLHSYGLFVILGFFAGLAVAVKEAGRRKLDPNIVLDLALPMLIVTVILCRLLFVALDPGQFHSLKDVVSIWSGGMSFHGALLGAFVVVGWMSYTRRVPFFRLADVLAPGVFLGYAIGRVGCFFNGCCYGGACDLPWAVRFPDDAHAGLLTPPSHPAQLYSSLLALGCFALIQWAKKRPAMNKFPGQVMLLFFALYAVERGIVEIFRNGATATTVFGIPWLTEAQFASLLALVAVAVTWGVLARRANRPATALSSSPHVPAG